MIDFSSFPDYSQKMPEAYDPRFFDLERFRKFLDECGISTKVPAILIAGSKGKGTTAHILSRLLTAQGKKTGLFTSPYLYDVREMIGLDGKMIPRNDFTRIVRQLSLSAKKFPGITFFEIMTATALLYFSQKKADFFVMEVGLGGLLDAVNVVTPIATVLTMVEREHAEILGLTLSKIIRAKLGITRPGVTLILGKQKKWIHELILKELKGKKVPIFDVGLAFSLKATKMTQKGTHFQCEETSENFSRVPKIPQTFFLGLHGEAAGWNALTALATTEYLLSVIENMHGALRPFGCAQGRLRSGQAPQSASSLQKRRKETLAYCSCLDEAISLDKTRSLCNARALRLLRRLREGDCSASLRNSRNDKIPGHFEIRHLPKGGTLVLDVLHTPESARNFRQTLELVFPNRPYVFIAAFLRDKNVPAIVKQLMRPRDCIFFPKISHPRAESPAILHKFFVQKFPKCPCATGDLSKILQKIAQLDCQQKIFCLIGSHYLLREAKKRNFLP